MMNSQQYSSEQVLGFSHKASEQSEYILSR